MTNRTASLLAVFFVMIMACWAATATAATSCSWGQPGANVFTGDRQAAIMSYTQMPLADRILLAWRVRFKEPTDTVSIGPNGVIGSPQYTYSDIQGMHFGRGQRCETVDRSMWPLGHTEPAHVWRQGNFCAVVPLVCGNVSLATCDMTPQAAAMQTTRHVPEPHSAALVLAALGCMVAASGKA